MTDRTVLRARLPGIAGNLASLPAYFASVFLAYVLFSATMYAQHLAG